MFQGDGGTSGSAFGVAAGETDIPLPNNPREVCGSLNVAQLGEGIDTRIAVALCTISVYFMSFLPSRVMTRVNVLANLSFIVCCAMFVFTGHVGSK